MASVNPPFSPKKQQLTRQWKTVWFNFSQTTTLHGVSYITQPTPFFTRRILWLLLVLTGFILFGYQALDRVMYYYQYPVTVNLKINHNKTMRFPALTICNQNSFRMTTAFRQGWYHSLDELFSLADPHTYNATQRGVGELDLDIIYSAAHQKEDMIVRCSWKGQTCRLDDFETIATDYGMCFTFNNNLTQTHQVSQTGVNQGLQLLLNVEQYEYMAGPHGAAGLKILLHDQADVPYVRDLGSAIPIGTSAYFGIRTVQINNLPHPYGECAHDRKLQHYVSAYSAFACTRECKRNFVAKRCGCGDIYLPGNLAICSLQDYLSCYLPASNIFDDELESSCDCPVPCSITTYDTYISYATISSRNADLVLHGPDSELLNKKYHMAGEVRQRVDPYIIQSDKKLIHTFTERYQQFLQNLEYASQTCHQIEKHSSLQLHSLEPRLFFHRHVTLYNIKRIIHHDFIRGYDVMDERTFSHVTTGYIQLISLFEWYLTYTLNQDTSQDMRISWYSILTKELIVKRKLVERAMNNITEVFRGYRRGDQILTYRSSYDRRYDKSFVAPKMLYHSKRLYGYYKDLKLGLTMSQQALNEFELILQDIHYNKSYDINAFNEAADKYRSGSVKYNYNRFLIADRIIYKAEDIWDEHIATFDKINDTMQHYAHEIIRACSSIKKSLDNFDLRSINKAVEMATGYLNNQSTLKLELAELVTSDSLSEHINGLTTLGSNLRLYGKELSDTWDRFCELIVEMWKNMLGEDQTYPFYRMIHDDLEVMFNDSSQYEYFVAAFNYFLEITEEAIKNKTKNELVRYLNADFAYLEKNDVALKIKFELQNASIGWDIANHIGESDINLAKATNKLQMSLKQFVSDTKLSSTFFGNNFLELNIFMQQLSYEEIQQQEAYDTGCLFSDIGGSLGLFIGASMITLAEVLDVIIHTLAQKLFTAKS